MEPHVLEPGLAANQLPRCVQIAEPRAGRAPEGDPGVARLPGHGGEHPPRRRRQRDGARAGLRLGQPELVSRLRADGETVPGGGRRAGRTCLGASTSHVVMAWSLAVVTRRGLPLAVAYRRSWCRTARYGRDCDQWSVVQLRGADSMAGGRAERMSGVRRAGRDAIAGARVVG